MFRRLVAIACMAGFALINPLPAAAADSLSCSVSPSTPGTWATLSCSFTVAKVLKSMQQTIPGSICHHSDSTCSPPDGTRIGTMSVTGAWLTQFCMSSTQTFDAEWVAPDGGYTPPSGWSVVAQINHVNALATVKTYIIENGSGAFEAEWPSWPSLFCSGHNTQVSFEWGTYNGTTYHIYMTPGTGTYTTSLALTFSDNSVETLNASFTIS